MIKAMPKRAKSFSFLILICSWLIMIATAFCHTYFMKGIGFELFTFAQYIGLGGLLLFMLLSLYFYIRQFYRDIILSTKRLATIYSIVTLSYVICVLFSSISILAMPVTLTALVMSVFFEPRVGVVTNIFCMLSIFLTLGSQTLFLKGEVNEELIAMLLISVFVGTIQLFVLNRNTRRFGFIIYGTLINLLSLVVVLLIGLVDHSFLSLAMSQVYNLGYFVIGSIVASELFVPIFERVFNITSNFRLMELTDHRQPLLKRLEEEAPGTFNHSLTVANLAANCASAIGENMHLARAAAYYHDVGKLSHPSFFKENQVGSENVHDELTPEASTDIIRHHAIDGEAICKRYRIPREIAAITREHHGTTPIAYFYYKAKQLTDGRVPDIKDYSYMGPTPSTKIAAMIMICDACEAAFRAMDKPTPDSVNKLVGDLVTQRMQMGQFDDCPITMQDLYTIRKTLVNSVFGMYHERIKYPE